MLWWPWGRRGVEQMILRLLLTSPFFQVQQTDDEVLTVVQYNYTAFPFCFLNWQRGQQAAKREGREVKQCW